MDRPKPEELQAFAAGQTELAAAFSRSMSAIAAAGARCFAPEIMYTNTSRSPLADPVPAIVAMSPGAPPAAKLFARFAQPAISRD